MTTKDCFGLWRSVSVEEHISVSVILLTFGELGIAHDTPSMTPSDMQKIRAQEFERSMGALGAHGVALGFADLYMSLMPIERVVSRVLEEVRRKDFGALFSFHPYEMTPQFDHPDHNLAGLVTKIVDASSDVQYFYPHLPAAPRRPELYFWTTQVPIATHYLDVSAESKKRRNDHLSTYYPSQFPDKKKSEWVSIFDYITYKRDLSSHAEIYMQVR